MTNEILREAIQLSKAGQKEAARLIFEALLRDDPHNETAWLWYVDTLENDTKRIEALEQCLLLNPGSELAKRALTLLKKRYQEEIAEASPIEMTTPEVVANVPVEESVPPAASEVPQEIPPGVPEVVDEIPPPEQNLEAAETASETATPEQPLETIETASMTKHEQMVRPVRKSRRRSRTGVWFLACFTIVLVIVMVVLAILYLSNSEWLSMLVRTLQPITNVAIQEPTIEIPTETPVVILATSTQTFTATPNIMRTSDAQGTATSDAYRTQMAMTPSVTPTPTITPLPTRTYHPTATPQIKVLGPLQGTDGKLYQVEVRVTGVVFFDDPFPIPLKAGLDYVVIYFWVINQGPEEITLTTSNFYIIVGNDSLFNGWPNSFLPYDNCGLGNEILLKPGGQKYACMQFEVPKKGKAGFYFQPDLEKPLEVNNYIVFIIRPE